MPAPSRINNNAVMAMIERLAIAGARECPRKGTRASIEANAAPRAPHAGRIHTQASEAMSVISVGELFEAHHAMAVQTQIAPDVDVVTAAAKFLIRERAVPTVKMLSARERTPTATTMTPATTVPASPPDPLTSLDTSAPTPKAPHPSSAARSTSTRNP